MGSGVTSRIAYLLAGTSLGFLGAGVLVVLGADRLRKALPI